MFGFWSIPFGETTGGENRFAPPVPKAPLNDGKVSSSVFDSSRVGRQSRRWPQGYYGQCPSPPPLFAKGREKEENEVGNRKKRGRQKDEKGGNLSKCYLFSHFYNPNLISE